MTGSGDREGGCGCGAVRYRVTGEPIMVHNCHCRQCQQQTGSTSVVNAFWESERVAISGALEESSFPAGSGGAHIIRRCAACGTSVISHYPRSGRALTAIRVGTLDDPAGVTPDAVVFAAEKLPWVTLPQGIPAFDAFYDYREVLPPERFERLKALSRRAREDG